MGARGPAAKPTAIKQLQGNPGKRALNRNEPRPGAGRAPSAPRWMSLAAKREWRRLAPRLHAAGLLTEVDGVGLAMLCEAIGLYVEGKEALAAQGSGGAGEQGSGGAGEQGGNEEAKAKDAGETPAIQGSTLFVKSDKGNLYQHPAVGVMNSARGEVLKWAREFGMTPAARSRISVEAKGEEPSLADLLFEAVGGEGITN